MAKFKFNLLPPKSKAEVQKLEERDNAIVYSTLLIFSTVLVFFVLNLLDIFILGGRISSLESTINSLDAQINQNSEVISKHGELILKSNLLQPILLKDIKIEELLNSVKGFVDTSKIKSYGREQNGDFTLTLDITNYSEVTEILDKGKQVETIDNLKVLRIAEQSTENSNDLTLSIKFRIKS